MDGGNGRALRRGDQHLGRFVGLYLDYNIMAIHTAYLYTISGYSSCLFICLCCSYLYLISGACLFAAVAFYLYPVHQQFIPGKFIWLSPFRSIFSAIIKQKPNECIPCRSKLQMFNTWFSDQPQIARTNSGEAQEKVVHRNPWYKMQVEDAKRNYA